MTKKHFMQLIEKYATASRADELAASRDAHMSVLRRHNATLAAIRAELEREIEALTTERNADLGFDDIEILRCLRAPGRTYPVERDALGRILVALGAKP